MADLLDLDLELYGHEPLVRRAWRLRGNLTAYDAAYVALAEGLDAPLLTTDENLAGAPGNDAVVRSSRRSRSTQPPVDVGTVVVVVVVDAARATSSFRSVTRASAVVEIIRRAPARLGWTPSPSRTFTSLPFSSGR